MDRTAADPAEPVFAAFLERVEAGEPDDFDALCTAHPALAPALRRLHLRWRAMTRAFAELSLGSPAASADDAARAAARPAAIDALLRRLRAAGAGTARYAIGAEIARGAMGRIHHAWDEDLRRQVAVKVHRGEPGDERQQRRFLAEAQIAAQLDHPGIVPIHELGVDAEGRPFFSMRLVRGDDLGVILGKLHGGDPAWTRTRVLHVLLRACEAMAFAHDRGVVHRDLKPQNVMVGSFGETYVMDWGLARVRGETADDGDGMRALSVDGHESDPDGLRTHHGDVLGTPAYMAPEQAAGGAHCAGPAVDVYAIGAMLYHLLAGRAPYASAGADADALLRAVRAGPPPPLPDDVPAELRAVCERAMARTPGDRYADMAALADDLRAFLEVRTVRAYATGRFAELRQWLRRNRALAAAAGALLLALVVGSGAVTALWLRAERDRERADASSQRLTTELDRSAFRNARQALRLDDSSEAGDALWRAHLAGTLPRATTWALRELAEHDPYLVTVPLHANLQPVAFARAAGAVLLGGADGRLQLRDAETLALRAELGRPGPAVLCVAEIDGSLCAAGNADGELLLFDLETGAERRRVPAHRGRLRLLAATGRGFATGGADGRVLWWSGPDAEPLVVLDVAPGITALAASADGTRMLAGDQDGGLHGCAAAPAARWRRQVADGDVQALAFGRDLDELWIGSTDHTLRRVDLADPGRDLAVPTRNGTSRQLARDRDGSILVGGWWRTDRFAADGAGSRPVALRGVSRFALDADAGRLVTTGVQSGLGLVDVTPRDRRHHAGAAAMALSADGRRLALALGGQVEVRDVDSDRVLARVGASGFLRLDGSGERLAVATRQPPVVQVFDVASGMRRFAADGPTDIPFGDACTFSPDGRELALRVGRDRVQRRRSDDGSLLAEYVEPGRRPLRLAWSHDGRTLAVIWRDRADVRRIDVATGGMRDVPFAPVLPTGVPTTLSAVALSPDGTRIAVGTWQGGVLVQDASGTATTIPAHAGTVWSLQFASNDPGLLVSAGGALGFACWDLDSMECCYQAVHDVAGPVQLADDGRTIGCLLPTGALLLDLGYRDRHVAGNLAYHLERLRQRVAMPAGREAALRAAAAAVLAAPWPRWH